MTENTEVLVYEPKEPAVAVETVRRGASADLKPLVASTRQQLDALRPRWIEAMSHCGVESAGAFADLFTTFVEVAPADAEPHVAVFGDASADGPKAVICGRIERRSVLCRFGYFSLRTPMLRCMIVDDGGLFSNSSPAASKAIVDHLKELLSSGGAQYLEVRHLPLDHPAFPALSRLATISTGPEPHWRLNLPSSFEEFMKPFSPKHRYNRRRQDRMLCDHFGGKVTMRKFDSPDHLDEFIAGASDIVAKSYQGGLGVGLSDNAYWRSVLGTEARRGRFCGYWLESEGRPFVFQAAARWGTSYRVLATSFLPELRQLAPGIVLHLRVLKLLCEQGVRTVDYGFGDAEHKRTYSSQSCEEGSLRIYGSGIRARCSGFLDCGINIASRLARWMTESLGITSIIKRKWRDRLQHNTE
jgi:CelD/BcsL family acetyltransferase involved in cellulose biosynthesis